MIDSGYIASTRREAGLTQAQLALMLGVHVMTVSKWERGTSDPAPYNVQQLRLLADGLQQAPASARARMHDALAMGAGVVALATIVVHAPCLPRRARLACWRR
jgi:transcriptional regulator with XRE-family HTH domain